MHDIICSRSGLTFQAETRRSKVHPKISYYTSHKDMDLRYTASGVIARGKAEGWETLEKFLTEIEKALQPEPEPETDWEGAWVAKIDGSDEKYRFRREFIESVRSEERGKSGQRFKRHYFCLAALPDGIYEGCYKSAKGNETRSYWRIESGVATDIELSVVEGLFPAVNHAEQVRTVVVAKRLGLGEVVNHDGGWYRVVSVVASYYNDDGEEVDEGDYAEICSTRYSSTLKPVSLDEIANMHRAGHALSEDAIIAAVGSGALGQSAAMNSDL